MYPQCTNQCSTYLSFRQHIVRHHSNVKEGIYFCEFRNCSSSFSIIKSLKTHNLTHIKKSTNDTYSFGFCNSKNVVFKTINAYRIHFSRFNKVDNNDTSSHEDNNISDNNDTAPDDVNTDSHFESTAEIISSEYNAGEIKNARVTFSHLYAKLSAKHLATEPLIQNVIDSVYES